MRIPILTEFLRLVVESGWNLTVHRRSRWSRSYRALRALQMNLK